MSNAIGSLIGVIVYGLLFLLFGWWLIPLLILLNGGKQ